MNDGIIVKGIQMPQYCEDCLFRKRVDGMTMDCLITGTRHREGFAMMPYKLKDCPLVPFNQMTDVT